MDAARYDSRQQTIDPGLSVLDMLLRLRKIEASPEDLRGIVGENEIGVAEMLRCGGKLGLKARVVKTRWRRLAKCPLPGIACLRDGGFLLLGKASKDKVIVLAPDSTRPSLMTRAEFEGLWNRRLVLMTEPGALRRLARKLGRFVKPQAVKQAARLTTNRASAEIIDFADRVRKFRGAVDLQERLRRIRLAVGFEKLAEDRRRADEIAFLPAALEIVETPPSPVGRAVAFSIMAAFAVALAWASFGAVDIVAVASGKIVPSGRTKMVQPFETGVVRAINVRDGQRVKAGDVLIELDPTMSGAELRHSKNDLIAAQLETARLRAALNAQDPLAAFEPPRGAPADQIEMHRRFLVSQTTEQNAKIAAIDRQVAQKEAERATIKASIEKLEATIAPLQQRVEIREQLFRKELGSKLVYLTELQDLVAQRQEVLVQQSRYNEAEAAIASLVETRSKSIAEYERGLLDDLAKADQKAAGLAQDVVKAEQRTSLQRLTAPVDGMVQQLAVHTVGGVVTPAQALLVIVPAESELEIEAMVSNRDIGFLEVGQDAAIKVDTFNFTRYGLLHGKILSVSQDAITRDKPQDKTADKLQGADAGTSEPKGQELVYAARVSLDRTRMELENKQVNLSPGMAVTVEIKTGSRSILSYLLSPLARYKQDSLRER